jgi:hypothetical protein
MANASCQGNCNASAHATASCSPPSLSIQAGASASAAAVDALKAHMPQLYLAAKVRGDELANEISNLGSAGASVTADIGGNISAKATLCAGGFIAPAIANGALNAKAAVTAGATIITQVGM